MSTTRGFFRRARTAAILALALPALGACATMDGGGGETTASIDPGLAEMYGARPDELHPLPATDLSRVDPKFLRRQVAYRGAEAPGTIVVDTRARYLYLVQEGGEAMRYGIGVGKEGLAFAGEARVGRKAEWPRWTPTKDMIAREPDRYGPVADGVAGGLKNPLGPRALYLYQGNRDTLFRIHGTTEPWSIGRAVSSGCIRMLNQDVIDLYGRVPKDSPVVVIQDEPAIAAAPDRNVDDGFADDGYRDDGFYDDDAV